MRNNFSSTVSVRFLRQLAWLLESGEPLSAAHDALRDAAGDAAMRELLDRLGAPTGNSVADWLVKSPRRFAPAVVDAVRDAESHGKGAQCLDVLASDLFRTDALEDGGRGILFYPIAVLLVMAVIGALYDIFVLPAFGELYASFSTQLPAVTRVALALPQWLLPPLVVLALLIFATITFSGFSQRLPRLHRLGVELTQQILAFMGYRRFRAELVWARITRIVGAAAENGLNTGLMMHAAASTTLDVVESRLLRQAAEKLAGQEPLRALLEMPRLPHFIREMLVIGSRTRREAEALAFAGSLAQEQARGRISVARQRFEVVSAIVMGIFVGLMVVALYLPIFNMASAVE
jgi:type IV pilus assembly protein PilC